MSPDTLPDSFKCRQAIEALRNGVPNRAAVEILGCHRPDVENRFNSLLAQAADSEAPPEGALGMLVSGDFGSGKSHLLSYLEHKALAEGFACSRVAISKETPLYNLGRVFVSAIHHTRLAGRTGQLMQEIGLQIQEIGLQTQDSWTREYDRFFQRVKGESSGLHQYFPATLMIYEISQDFDLQSEIEAFWGGESIKAVRVRDGLRLINQLRRFPGMRAPRPADLPPQRLRFATELIKGVGYKGWVVLLDELELVGSYSPLQRARSYAELARWLGNTGDERYPGLITVGTVTAGFEAEVLGGGSGKNDRTAAANRLRERDGVIPASRAEAGIRALERDCISLPTPAEGELRETLAKLKLLYAQAYQWDAPDLTFAPDGAAYRNTMRYRIRAAINEWDLRRIYPDAEPETEGHGFDHRYAELPDMEKEVKDDE